MFSTVVVATSSDKELAVVIAGNIVEARVCRHPPSTASSCVCVCACVCVHVVFFFAFKIPGFCGKGSTTWSGSKFLHQGSF